MTTTDSFQKFPAYYKNKEECMVWRLKTQTNTRYPGFDQTHFTAGDEEQFDHYRYLDDMSQSPKPAIVLERNLFSTQPTKQIWEKYGSIQLDTIPNTFRYIFHKFKKGIFVKIKDNRLRVFLPFSKANYTNEWSGQINCEKKTFLDFAKSVHEAEGRRYFNPSKINTNVDEWYGNNCLVRYEAPLCEQDTNVDNVKNMLDELCASRSVPDIEFFINKRDFPLLTKDGTEPYNNIWDTTEKKLVSHSYDKYVPILSMSTSARYADIAIPNHNDWGRVQSREKKWFSRSCTEYVDEFSTPWDKKKPTAVFRGATTGCGVTIQTNQRLKVANISFVTPPDAKGIPYLDAGVTKWNLRPRKIQGSRMLKTIDVESMPFGLASFLSPSQQSQYKYVIHIEGHVAAFRLSLEMAMRSVILKVDSQWDVWYSHMLVPNVHYIPVKSDLSDLVEKIKWCRQHDEECKQIALNAREFYEKYLQKDGLLDFTQKVLVDLADHMKAPPYQKQKALDMLLDNERDFVKKYQDDYFRTSKPISSISQIPSMRRCSGLLGGFHEVVKKVLAEKRGLYGGPNDGNGNDGFFEDIARGGETIFSNKLSTVRKFTLAGMNMVVKKTCDDRKKREHVHEAFVGLTSTNTLLKQVPNFAYVFGTYINPWDQSFNIISEHIEGVTLFDYIKSSSFRIDEYYLILVQLLLALQMAQRECGFVHGDLTPWNIILQRLPDPIEISYKVSANEVVSVKSNLIPIMVDYGKSKVIHGGIHHGFVNPFQTSTVWDAMTLLLTSIKEVLKTRDVQEMIRLMNFVTKTDYHEPDFQTVDEVKRFLVHATKYSSMCSGFKVQLENKTPMDLLKWIGDKVALKRSRIYEPIMAYGNERQVFDYILSSNFGDRSRSFINVFRSVKNADKIEPGCDILLLYFRSQQIESNLMSVLMELTRFVGNGNDDLVKEAKSIFESIASSYKNAIGAASYVMPRKFELVMSGSVTQAAYTEDTCFRQLVEGAAILYNEHVYKMFETVFLQSKLTQAHRDLYKNTFYKIAGTNKLAVMNEKANTGTILFLQKIIRK